MNDANRPSGRQLYARLLRHVWPYRAALLGGVLAMIVGGLVLDDQHHRKPRVIVNVVRGAHAALPSRLA